MAVSDDKTSNDKDQCDKASDDKDAYDKGSDDKDDKDTDMGPAVINLSPPLDPEVVTIDRMRIARMSTLHWL